VKLSVALDKKLASVFGVRRRRAPRREHKKSFSTLEANGSGWQKREKPLRTHYLHHKINVIKNLRNNLYSNFAGVGLEKAHPRRTFRRIRNRSAFATLPPHPRLFSSSDRNEFPDYFSGKVEKQDKRVSGWSKKLT
jgi:hypothetical protein